LIPFQVNPCTLSSNRSGIKPGKRGSSARPDGSGRLPVRRFGANRRTAACEAIDPNWASTRKEQRHHAERHVDQAPLAGHDPPDICGTRLETRR
jgi:hypothetical protein